MKHNQMRQVVFPILAAFIWGTAFVAQDMCADSIGAFAFNASRYFIAVLALLVVIVISDKLKKDKPVLSPAEKKAANKQLWIGGLCCGAALAMASNFQQAGMVAGTDSGKAGFITALYVVLVPVFGLFFRQGQPPRLDRRGPVCPGAVSAMHQGQLLPFPRRSADLDLRRMLRGTYSGHRPFHRLL